MDGRLRARSRLYSVVGTHANPLRDRRSQAPWWGGDDQDHPTWMSNQTLNQADQCMPPSEVRLEPELSVLGERVRQRKQSPCAYVKSAASPSLERWTSSSWLGFRPLGNMALCIAAPIFWGEGNGIPCLLHPRGKTSMIRGWNELLAYQFCCFRWHPEGEQFFGLNIHSAVYPVLVISLASRDAVFFLGGVYIEGLPNGWLPFTKVHKGDDGGTGWEAPGVAISRHW